MKQMNDTQSEIDEKPLRNKLFSIAAICFSIMISTTAAGKDIDKDDNDSIVRAIYGFVDQNSSSTDQDMGEQEIIDLSKSGYGTAENTNLANEVEYANFLSNPIYLNNYFKTPRFFATHANARK